MRPQAPSSLAGVGRGVMALEKRARRIEDTMLLMMRNFVPAILFACLLLTPGAWAQCVSTALNTSNFTTSTRTFNHYTTNNVTQQVNTFLVELKARMQGGAYVFDQTYNVALTDPTVQAAVTQAKNLLSSAGAVSFSGPTQLSGTQSTSSATNTVENVTATNVSIATSTYVGPQTIMVGDNQSQCFTLLAGQQDIDTVITSDVYITRTATTTNTTLTSQVYELDGVPAGSPPPATPVPPSLMLALTGLAASGLYAIRGRLRRGVLGGRDSRGCER